MMELKLCRLNIFAMSLKFFAQIAVQILCCQNSEFESFCCLYYVLSYPPRATVLLNVYITVNK